jgi:hypothetical protein
MWMVKRELLYRSDLLRVANWIIESGIPRYMHHQPPARPIDWHRTIMCLPSI